MKLRERLVKAASKGGLSPSDLARWLDLPVPTLRDYTRGDRMPREYHRPRIEQRLSWLELAVEADPRLPVPPHVRLRQRAAYLRRIRADYER